MDIFTQIMGWLAAITTMVMYAPQVHTILKKKSAEGLSLLSYTLLMFGVLIWVIYSGFLKAMGKPIEMILQTYTPNAVIALILTIYFYFLTKSKIARLTYWISIAIAVALGTALLFIPGGTIKISTGTESIINILLAIFASAPIAVAFLPQTISTIKEKNTRFISLFSVCLIMIGNILWALFWIGNMFAVDAEIPRLSISLTFAVLAVVVQAPIFYLKITEKKRVEVTNQQQNKID